MDNATTRLDLELAKAQERSVALADAQAELDREWQHASPTGGFVTSDYHSADWVQVGHIVKVKGLWAIVQDKQVNTKLGVTHLVTFHGCLCLYGTDGALVRGDYWLAV